MQSFLIASTLYAVLTVTCSASSLGYPVFGTKRYTRANLLPPSEYGGSLSLPVYSPIIPQQQQQQQQQQQYYDSQPQYMPQYAASDYYDDSGYYGGNTNNYYYVPPVVHRRHQRHDRYPSFGLPTYRGEYKPTPYYYAHAPSYSYSDDRESNNPLDDLHEEMLQEDERERAREYMPVGTEQWYENLPPRHAPDSTFLRNLIMYNQQMNALRNKQQLESAEEYDEYEDSEPEYYDLNPSYVDNRNNYNAFVNPYTGSSNTPVSSSSSSSSNTFNKINSLRNSMAKNAVEDDEEVQELKSLIHQQKNSRLQHQQPQPQQQQYQVHTPNPMQDIKQQQQRSVANDYSQFGMDLFQQDSPQQQQQPQQYNNYEYDNEYDDSWSHWDRKRNVQPKKVTPTTTTTTTTTTASPSTSTTTTPKPIVEIIHGRNGQKEVVLPRPASPVRNPFANVNLGKLHKAQKPAAAGSDANVIAAAPPAGKTAAKPGSVYDTIKKIINMQQNVEDAELSHQLDSQKHQGSGRLQKRFVASAESLVQQLDGLKRTA
ncbi:conserved hypothetical protein [Culex quinquefasciatus]|uniref:Uncharacterized protein n=1 Tax=Culex quinquefasciatus TaxID=7176 RepID=B0W4M8_CULQU|nr:conserved hypothetical protein [Culex quinquefasciatus]|eukprot:XP_001843662.1 conserved hypothetical protein [Culex quinquefasciatus]